MKLFRFILLSAAAISIHGCSMFAQVADGSLVLQVKRPSPAAGFETVYLAPEAGKVVGWNEDGDLEVVDGGSGSEGLNNVASTISGNVLTLSGTLTAGRTVTVRDLAGTLALTSDLTPYLLASDAAEAYPNMGGHYENPGWIASFAWSKLSGVPSEFAPSAHTQAWSTITSTPTTRDGYGITDAQPLASSLTLLSTLSSPGADRILFWDQSAAGFTFLQASTGLSISGTTMTVRTANASQTGIVELATDGEAQTGSDTTRAVTPANLGAWSGSGNVTTLGTITTGTWSGTTIAANKGGTGVTALSSLNVNTLGSGAASSGQVPVANGSGGIAWDTPTGSGDVVGPGESTNGAFAIYDGITGKLLADSGIYPENFASEFHASSHVTGGTDKIRDATASQDGLATAAQVTKLDGIEATADVTDAANVDAAGAVMNADTSTASMSFVVDEDTMTSNSDTKVPTQQSVKAYVDAEVAGAGGGGGVAGGARFRVYKSGTQSISDNTETTVTWDTENWDPGNIFTSNAVTIPSGEGWLVGAKVTQLNSNIATSWNLRLKDGSTVLRETALGMRLLQGTDDSTIQIIGPIEGTGNALTITIQQVSGGTRTLEGGTIYCEFWGIRQW